MALKTNMVGIYRPDWPGGMERHMFEWEGVMENVQMPEEDPGYSFPASGPMGAGVEVSDRWVPGDPYGINLDFIYVNGQCWADVSRGLGRYPELDRLGPADIAHAWTNITASNPVRTQVHREYQWRSEPLEGATYNVFVPGKGKWWVATHEDTVTTTGVPISLQLMRVVPKNGHELEARMASGANGVANVSHGQPAKADVTAAVQAYLAHASDSVGFFWYASVENGFSTETDDWASVLAGLYGRYCHNNLTYEGPYYTGDYAQRWSIGTLDTEKIEFGGLGIGTVYVELAGGKTLDEKDRVFYGVPPRFQV